MGLSDLLSLLGDEIVDHEDETYTLFTTPLPSLPLGLYSSPPTFSKSSPKPTTSNSSSASTLTLPLGSSYTITISQSPTLLHSSLPGGTTGAMLWRISPLFANWMLDEHNPLWTGSTKVLGGSSKVLELGAGVSGVVALAVAARMNQVSKASHDGTGHGRGGDCVNSQKDVGKYIVTDQDYVLKLLSSNITSNLSSVGLYSDPASTSSLSNLGNSKTSRKARHAPSNSKKNQAQPEIRTLSLDWQTSSLTSLASVAEVSDGFDVVIGCDCIYNDALVEPFVSTCADICSLRSSSSVGLVGGLDYLGDTERGVKMETTDEAQGRKTLCIIAQQLRSSEVFEEWLRVFKQRFRVWRIPDEVLAESGLRVEEGFIIHVGILR